MLQKIMENARQIFLLSLAVFFLVATGLLFRLFWIQEPIQALGKRLLAKDGALLVSIISDAKTIRAVRALTAPRQTKSGVQRKSIGHYLIDRMFEQKGAFLKEISVQLLKESTIKKLLTTKKSPSSPSPEVSPLVGLGRYTIDRVLEKDARVLNFVVKTILEQLNQQKVKTQKKGAQVSPSPEAWRVIEQLGKHAIGQLFQKDGKVALQMAQKILKQVLKNQNKHKVTPSKPLDFNPLLDRLGRHTVDRLLASRARSLRAIIQDLFGPEPQRTMRVLRQSAALFSQQLTRLDLTHLVREAAYQLGRGGLDSFLLNQEKQKQTQLKLKVKIRALSSQLRPQLRKQYPCFVPKGKDWLSLKRDGLKGHLYFLSHQSSQCDLRRCLQKKRLLRQMIERSLRSAKIPQVHTLRWELKLTPKCQKILHLSPKHRTKQKTAVQKKVFSEKNSQHNKLNRRKKNQKKSNKVKKNRDKKTSEVH